MRSNQIKTIPIPNPQISGLVIKNSSGVDTFKITTDSSGAWYVLSCLRGEQKAASLTKGSILDLIDALRQLVGEE